FHFKHTLSNFKNGNIKCTTTKIVNCNSGVFVFVHSVRKCGGGWFIDNTVYGETSNLTSILGCLTLRIIEVSWDCDDGVLNLLVQVVLSSFLHLLKHESTNL